MELLIRQHKADVIAALDVLDSDPVHELLHVLDDARRRGRRVALAGNGGSGGTAGHLATDWFKAAQLRTVDLCGSVPMMTALANDEGYDQVFARQIANHLSEGDVAVLISTSGASKNVLEAARAAGRQGVFVVALTGRPNTALGRLSDVEVCVGVAEAEVAEDIHLTLGHAIARALAGSRARTASGSAGSSSSPLTIPVSASSPVDGS